MVRWYCTQAGAFQIQSNSQIVLKQHPTTLNFSEILLIISPDSTSSIQVIFCSPAKSLIKNPWWKIAIRIMICKRCVPRNCNLKNKGSIKRKTFLYDGFSDMWTVNLWFHVFEDSKLRPKVVSLRPGVSLAVEAEGLHSQRIPLVSMNTTLGLNFWNPNKTWIPQIYCPNITEYRHSK